MATYMPPDWSNAAGKFKSPAPRAAFTTKNTDAYQLDPEIK